MMNASSFQQIRCSAGVTIRLMNPFGSSLPLARSLTHIDEFLHSCDQRGIGGIYCTISYGCCCCCSTRKHFCSPNSGKTAHNSGPKSYSLVWDVMALCLQSQDAGKGLVRMGKLF
jgi:hypothetical protein